MANKSKKSSKLSNRRRIFTYSPSLAILSLSACGGDDDISNNANTSLQKISLVGNRSDYKIDASSTGFTLSQNGEALTNTKSGELEFSDGGTYVLRDTANLVANASSHLENYSSPETLIGTNVTWLHTGAWWGNGSSINVFESPEALLQFPSRGEFAVNTAYINISEISGVGDWDPHWDEKWDTNGDNIIDVDNDQLPTYLQGLDLNEYWGNYVVNYWEPEWKTTLYEKIDIVMAQNFDGVMFDVTSGWIRKIDDNPNAVADMATLMSDVTTYLHDNYGNTALATFNIGYAVLEAHPELAGIIDAAYFQNSFFKWDGTGELSDSFDQSRMDDLRELFNAEGKALFVMDHLDDLDDDKILDYLVNSLENDTIPMIGSHLFENFTDYPIFRITQSDETTLTGWDNNDFFYSDSDTVTLIGGGGDDVFSFAAKGIQNTITDFDISNDKVIFFDSEYNLLGSDEIQREETTDGSLMLSASTGTSIILENCSLADPINLYGEILA